MRFLAIFVLFFSLTSSAVAAGKSYIVTIGINQYGDPTWNALHYASKDAADVYQHFQKWYDGGWMVTDGGEDGQPAKPVRTEDIRAALKRLQAANVDETDTVIIYISSHGSIGRRLNPLTKNFELDKLIVTADTKADNPTETGFSHSELLDVFRSLKSRRKALILDSCYSGTGKSKLNARMVALLAKQKSRFFDAPSEDPGEGSVVLAASAWGEEAQEYAEGKNGLYTHFLLEGFNKGLGRGDAVTLTEAHAYATQEVKAHTQGLQNPTAVIELVGNDPILVKGKVNGIKKPMVYAFDWTAKRLRVLVDGVDKGSMEKGTLEIPEGLRRITIVEPEKKLILSDRTMVLSQGQEYALNSFLDFHPRYSLGLQSRYGRWLDQRSQEILGRDGFSLLGIEGTVYDVGGRFDLSFAVLGNSDIRSSFDSDSNRIEQSISYYTAQIYGGKRWLLSGLSDFGESKGIQTFLVVKTGLVGSHIRRHIQAAEYLRDRQMNQRLGLGASAELQTLLLDTKLLLSGGLNLSVVPDLAMIDGTTTRAELSLSLSRAY